MISIDNAVELMIKTYLGLPKRITGITLSRRDFENISESFPALLDALELHAPDKLTGIDLGPIEWYHRLRNQLYHQGNGLTVERDKVEIYAQLADTLFQNLFGTKLVQSISSTTDLLAKFLMAWSGFEAELRRVTSHTVTRPSLKTTTRCHSVFSFRSPLALSFQLSAVAIERLQTRPPD